MKFCAYLSVHHGFDIEKNCRYQRLFVEHGDFASLYTFGEGQTAKDLADGLRSLADKIEGGK